MTEEAERENYFSTVDEFVANIIAPFYAAQIADRNTHVRWCAWWFLHATAVARLEACWRAWEALRLEAGTGASTWFTSHADPCMAVLMASEGPFRNCSDTSHRAYPPLPLAESGSTP